MASREAARRLTERQIDRGARLYDRHRILPRLIRVSEAELNDGSPEGTAVIVERLRNSVRAATNMVRSGHWAADGNRLIGLRQALQAEEAALENSRD